ncbi:MAG TPA: FAD-dependent oxidoreductase, partial [Aggregatilineales bacterium]|nr:FAD-dependent oxidoreductase [Aggregatilineales bacterium]
MAHVIVIGGGPAGVTAALRARELGARVSLVERGLLGGSCTNDGCVPTRVLAKAARLMRDSLQFGQYGLIGEPPRVDFRGVLARTQQVVYQIQEKKQLLAHLEDVQIETYTDAGAAAFRGPHSIQLGTGQELEGDRFILCTGGSPRRLTFPGSEYAIGPDDVWQMTTLPGSVVIVGGGATGCQLASVFESFGAHVTLLDAAPRILPPEDEAVSATIAGIFQSRGMDIVTGI